eukprot:6369316-Prymnesium_polylepis.1
MRKPASNALRAMTSGGVSEHFGAAPASPVGGNAPSENGDIKTLPLSPAVFGMAKICSSTGPEDGGQGLSERGVEAPTAEIRIKRRLEQNSSPIGWRRARALI